ncbi:hypothetical protein TNCV_2538331 [Trichonephila clavipes]|nr:hypothetical protein TNCV_2538331 [Trichonephila clavipes]
MAQRKWAAEHRDWMQNGLMVWDGINLGGRTDLHIVLNGNLKAKRIMPEMVQRVIWRKLLEVEKMRSMGWTAYSTDLNLTTQNA